MTYEWFGTSMSADVDIQVCLLVEALVAARHVALIPLPRLLVGLACLFLYLGQYGIVYDSNLDKTYFFALGGLLWLWLLCLDCSHQGINISSEVDAGAIHWLGSRTLKFCSVVRSLVRRTRLQR